MPAETLPQAVPDVVEPLLSPKERLARSREALLFQLQGGKSRVRPALQNDPMDDPRIDPDARAAEAAARVHEATRPGLIDRFADRFVWASVGRNVIERWWRRHPANAATQLAKPLLERYARREPVKLMAGAAAVGAVIVLVKPWRLLSVTALMATLLKTSDVADLVTTLMYKNSSPRKDFHE